MLIHNDILLVSMVLKW